MTKPRKAVIEALRRGARIIVTQKSKAEEPVYSMPNGPASATADVLSRLVPLLISRGDICQAEGGLLDGMTQTYIDARSKA